MDVISKVVTSIHERLKGERVNWEGHWQEVTDFLLPRKRNVFDHRTQPGGDKRQEQVYDSTPIQAAENLTSFMQGSVTNPNNQWLQLTTGDAALDQNKDVKEWLQKASRKMVDIMNSANFQPENNEFFLDLVVLGTGVLRIEEDDETVVRFQSRPIYEHYIREDYKGMVNLVSREYKLESRQIKQKFLRKKSDVNKLKNRLEIFDVEKLKKFEDDPYKEWNLIHMVMPRDEFDKEDLPGIARRFKYISVHVVEDLNIAISVGGFEELPYAVARWSKTSNEKYGRGPGIKALPDIKMLNEMMKTTIIAAQKVVDPTLQAPDDGVLLPISTIPGGINYYRAGTTDRIEPLQTGARLDISEALMEDVRRRIKEAFFIDQLQLPLQDRMTATESLQRTEEQLRILGPVGGRVHFEYLRRVVNRVFNIMARKDLLPPNPPSLLEDIDLNVEFSSQIARAQRASEADNITRVINLMAPIAQAQPELLDNVDGDGLLRFVGNLFNVPQEMFKSLDEVEEMREARQQAVAQQQQLNTQTQQAQIAKDLNVQVGS